MFARLHNGIFNVYPVFSYNNTLRQQPFANCLYEYGKIVHVISSESIFQIEHFDAVAKKKIIEWTGTIS